MEPVGIRRYRITLSEDERKELTSLTRSEASARKRRSAQVLLLADEGRADGGKTDSEIASTLLVGRATVERVRKQCVLEGLAAALERRKQGYRKSRKPDAGEARLVAEARYSAPRGHSRWTLRLLSSLGQAELEFFDVIGTEKGRETSGETDVTPWLKRYWRIPPKPDAAFVCAMEDVLEVYCRSFDPDEILLCIGEASKQQTREIRLPGLPRPGQPAVAEFEYVRNGTTNLFMAFAPLGGWRQVQVTDRRTRQEWATFIRSLVDERFPDKKLILVADNPHVHSLSSLYEAFERAEARRIARRIEIHYTPKRGSWLNLAEIEIGALHRQCLSRRIPDREALIREVEAWEAQRNLDGSAERWRFTTDDARVALRSLYPALQ